MNRLDGSFKRNSSIVTLLFFLTSFLSFYPANANAEIYSSISGTVRDSVTGEGISGVEVFAAQEPFTETSGAGTAITNREGKYTIDILPSGSYKLFIKVPAEYVRTDEIKKVSLIKGKNLLGVDFYILKSGSIEGTIYQSDGITVLPNTKIFVSTDNGFGQGQTDSNGKYIVFGLPPALSTAVKVIASGYQGIIKNINIISGQVTTGINIIVNTDASISLKGIITDIDNLPILNAIVIAATLGNLGIGETDKEGKYSISGLIPDNNYEVVVLASAYKPYIQKNVVINKDIPTELNIGLQIFEFVADLKSFSSQSLRASSVSSNKEEKIDLKCYTICRAQFAILCASGCGIACLMAPISYIVCFLACWMLCNNAADWSCKIRCRCK